MYQKEPKMNQNNTTKKTKNAFSIEHVTFQMRTFVDDITDTPTEHPKLRRTLCPRHRPLLLHTLLPRLIPHQRARQPRTIRQPKSKLTHTRVRVPHRRVDRLNEKRRAVDHGFVTATSMKVGESKCKASGGRRRQRQTRRADLRHEARHERRQRKVGNGNDHR